MPFGLVDQALSPGCAGCFLSKCEWANPLVLRCFRHQDLLLDHMIPGCKQQLESCMKAIALDNMKQLKSSLAAGRFEG